MDRAVDGELKDASWEWYGSALTLTDTDLDDDERARRWQAESVAFERLVAAVERWNVERGVGP